MAFLCKFGLKSQNCLFKMKCCTYINYDMLNSRMDEDVYIFVLDQKYVLHVQYISNMNNVTI